MTRVAVAAKQLDVTIGDLVEIDGRAYDVVSDKAARTEIATHGGPKAALQARKAGGDDGTLLGRQRQPRGQPF